jgi:DNA-binding CsgD family transcriptional regulator
MSDVLPAKITQVIDDYLPVIAGMSSRKRNDLISGILQMQNYGVEAFANRVIYPNGYSSMFCTSANWKKLNKDEDFQKDFINHVSCELVKLYKNKISLVSRSRDKIYNKFLIKLEDAGVNNSVIINEFYKDRIEVIYYMADPAKPEDRDLILNNLELLSFIRKSIRPALNEIFLSKAFLNKKELLLNSSAIDVLWSKVRHIKNSFNVCIAGQEVDLTYRELEYLALLRFGSNNQFIADYLKISIETVKRNLSDLKFKFLVHERNDLIKLAQDGAITNMSKIIGII